MAISKLILNGITQMDVTSDTVSAGKLLSGETATKNDGTKVTGTIASKTSSDLTASGATVTAPAGYYASNASKSISNGTQGTPSFNRSTGTNSTTLTPVVVNTAGYINGGTKTGTAVTISASQLVSGTYTVDSSGTKDVTNYASISVPSGTAGTPTATKGTVSNHAVNVTPSVTNTTGYITGSTKTGTAVTISASQLVSGTKSINSNGTGIDVTNYANVDVDVSATPNPGLYVTPNYDDGWYLPNSGVYVTAIPYVLEEEWEEKYETDVLMTSSSTSHSESTHESTATIILDNNISNGKGFFCLLQVFYGEFQQDYIWLWSDNITIGTTQLNFQSMLDIATVKSASFTSANTLQIVFDWQNVYQGVNGIDDFFGSRFSSGVTINENLNGCRGVIVRPPSGTEQFTENGSYDVRWDETVEVNVTSGAQIGSFEVHATSLPSGYPNYIWFVALVPNNSQPQILPYVPLDVYINGTGTASDKTLYWYIHDDGYMYVTIMGTTANYTPQLEATSGTASLFYTKSGAGTYNSYYPKGIFTVYKISNGAQVNLSYYNNN